MDLPADPQLRWILRRSATLVRLGAEPVRGLVQPTSEFFPDVFDGSPPTVATLLARIQEHAGLADLPVELSIVTPEGEAQTVNCASGACGGTGKIEARLNRVGQREDGTYTVSVGTGELRNPTVLTTAFVRAVSCMFLTEAGAYDELEPGDREPATDLASVLLGFGVIAANGSYIYVKGCGGVAVHSATRMPVEEVGVALSIFCQLHDIPERVAAKHLDPTPREALDEGAVWARSNAAVVRLLRSNLAALEEDDFRLSPARSWLARTLGFGKRRPTARATDDELAELERSLAASPEAMPRRAPDEKKAKRLAELRALVDESLD
jgi:hypothetical protein